MTNSNHNRFLGIRDPRLELAPGWDTGFYDFTKRATGNVTLKKPNVAIA